MRSRHSITVDRSMRALFSGGSSAGLTDVQLLERLARPCDSEKEAAFTALVARHGPMVLGTCRRILGDSHTAEDAFQATFLVLARKFRSVRVEHSLGRWLHGVAYRVATTAKLERFRRRIHEIPLENAPHATELNQQARTRELREELDRELLRLPEKYRSAILLCVMEGLTHAEAAKQLGRPVGTLSAQVSRGCALLRTRLERRGLHSVVPLGLALSAEGKATVFNTLANSTIRGAMCLTLGEEVTGFVSAPTFQMTQGVLKAMLQSQLKQVAVALFVAGSIAAGTVAIGQQDAAPPQTNDPTPRQNVEQELVKLERELGNAVIKANASTADRILAYEMVGTDPGGNFWDKTTYLKQIESGAFRAKSFEIADVRVRTFGDAAVVTGTSIVDSPSWSDLPRGKGRFTNTYIRRQGQWQCVAWAVVDIAGKEAIPSNPSIEFSGIPSQLAKKPPNQPDTPKIELPKAISQP